MATSNKKLSKFQNKVRGIIAQRKAQNIYGQTLTTLNEKLKRDIKETLFLSRAELEINQYSFFIEWTHNQVEKQVKDNSVFLKKTYVDVAGLFRNMTEVEWEREVVWVIERLKFESEKINSFFDVIVEIERNAYLGDYEKVIKLLDDFEEKNGASLWSIQLRIGFEQVFQGLAEQKKCTNTFRKIYKTGLLTYITFFLSSRNEVKTNYIKFVEDVTKSINSHRYYKKNKFLLNYLEYKILGKYPHFNELKDLLLVEQAHSIYDLYDTFINIVQFILVNNKESVLLNNVVDKISELNVIKDYRIHKIIGRLCGVDNVDIKQRDYQWFDGGKNSSEFRERIFSENGVDIFGIFNKGYNFYETGYSNPENIFEQSISGFLEFSKLSQNSANIINQFNKHILNFNMLPSVKGISHFLKPLNDSDVNCFFEYWNIGLNSPTSGVEDYRIKQSESNNKCIDLIYNCIDLLNKGKYGLAYSDLMKLYKEGDCFSKNYSTHTLLKLFYLQNDVEGILSVLRDIDISFLKNYNSVSFVKILKLISYEDVTRISNCLDRSNIIYICLLNNDNGNLLASLRLSIKAVCMYYKIDRPSKLLVQSLDEKMINFLSEICIPNNLDMCRLQSLKGSKLVIEERLEICNKLRSIDKINSDRYEHELSRLHYLRTLEAGHQIVSSSRIYVDVESFKKWAMHDLAGEIERYKDLADIIPDQNVQYLELIQGIYNDESYLSSFIPTSDADLLLLGILRRCEQAFLFNSNWGLDYYLSKRIRHQSFIGRIRNVLEQSNLITTKVSENGSYQDNEHWIGYLCKDHPEFHDKLQRVFKNFSASFDKKLLDLKDNKLHIKSLEKPEGMLNLNIPVNYIPILRYVMDQEDFDSILTSLLDVLWGSLNLSLKTTRNYIITDLSKQISILFDGLKNNIKKQLGDDLLLINDRYLELDHQITACNSSIQAVLIEIGNWFTRNDLEAHTKYISAEKMIELAIEMASKSLNNIDITINNNVKIINNSEDDFALSLSNLPVFNDIFFILLDNVQEHSLLDKPEVFNNVIFNCDENIFEIEFINNCHSKAKVKNIDIVTRIKTEINSKSIIRSREEGNSGLIKLAAEDRDNFKIDFGYDTDVSFKVNLSYPLIYTNITASEDVLK
ncbi:hypothetical protein [Acinetobacter junii]|uniref:hypothetical protein n=1 Tax=Acinetobacter junii TaxID=40215 RepID=UPI0030F546F6